MNTNETKPETVPDVLAEIRRKLETIRGTVALGYQTGPYAYAGEDMGEYLREATSECGEILCALSAIERAHAAGAGRVPEGWALVPAELLERRDAAPDPKPAPEPEPCGSAACWYPACECPNRVGCGGAPQPEPSDAQAETGAHGSALRSHVVTIEAHWLQNIAVAATLLEQSASDIDRQEGAALRKLLASAKPVQAAQGDVEALNDAAEFLLDLLRFVRMEANKCDSSNDRRFFDEQAESITRTESAIRRLASAQPATAKPAGDVRPEDLGGMTGAELAGGDT